MNAIIAYLREVNTVSIILRLTLATLFAGIIGLERGKKKRPAGFRTHILVCIGATIIMITNQYIIDIMHMDSDPTRLGAQVISGIGFLGAGTIIVDRRNQVKGLTTAAGLWACACMGLAIGIGFYEGAIISCIFLFGVMTGLHKLDLYVQNNSKVINIYVEFDNISNVTSFIKKLRAQGIRISNLEVPKTDKIDKNNVGVVMTIRMLEKVNHADCILELHNEEGVLFIEEIS
ncbi:MgtC/SapB family protein [Clostridium bornimense]|uniref:MgtC/SapB family protein n=1 Tax=Clostridium bornimense TaxID=1216932 RepID=UPI001C120D8C|nr:MgtC/SapB family protein [Clostridium bornimense]MBU5316547.1 MgtC/SapB family protein [Clostridium bornimense]